jgi:hypothetical protein
MFLGVPPLRYVGSRRSVRGPLRSEPSRSLRGRFGVRAVCDNAACLPVQGKTLGKPIKNYFLTYGLRNGRMVLDKKLYAATPEYQTMYGEYTRQRR